MATNKTTATWASVKDFIDQVEDETLRDDSRKLIAIMKEASGEEPFMYGPTIVGFGLYKYTYASGHSGEAPLIGFSPRKAAFSLYLSSTFEGREKMLAGFGKHKVSKACIYFKRMSDIHIPTLKEMIKAAWKDTKKKPVC